MSGIIEEVADGFGLNNSNAETFYDAVWLIGVFLLKIIYQRQGEVFSKTSENTCWKTSV